MGFEVIRTRNREGSEIDNELGSRMRGTGWSNGYKFFESESGVTGSRESLRIQVSCKNRVLE